MAVKDNNRFKICCQGDEHILEILDTNKIDAGKYLCKLENTTGSISYTTSLIVKDNMPSMTDFRSVLRARPSLEKLGKHNSTDSEKSDKENEQHDFRRVLTQRGDKDSHLQKQENKNSQTSVKQHDFTQVLTRHVDKVSQLQKEENNNSHTPVKQCDFSQVLTRHVDKVSHQQKQDDNYHTSAKQLDFRKVLKNKAEKLEKVSVDIGKIVPETNGGGTVRGKLNKFETNASTSRSKPRAQTEEIHRAQITQVKKSPPCGISVKAPEKEITENSLKRHLDKFEPKTVTSRSKSRAQTEEIHRVQITHVEKSPFGISVKNPQNEETDSPLKRHPDKFEPKTVTSRLKPRAQTEEIHHVESSVETDSPLKRQLDKFEKLPSNESRKSRNVSAESTTKPPKDANSSLKGKLNKFENLASYETSKPQTETTTILLPKGTENLNSLKGKLSKFEKISSGEVSLKPKKEPPVLPSLKTRTDKFERPFGDSCKTESLKKTDYLAKVKMDKFEKFASLEITTKPKAEQKDFRNVLKKNIDDQRQAPRIRRKLTNQRVKYGNPVVMECEIDGDTVDWSINGKEIKPSKFFKISLSQDNTATLVIAEAYSEDEGEYICTASNKFGSASSSCHLFVEASSSHSSKSDMEGPVTVPVRILSLTPSSIAVLKGNRIEIKATFTGEPKPEIRWFKARDEVYTGGKIQVKNCEENSILVIGDIQPNNSGKYTIKADNHIATDSASVSVSVEDVPEPPVGKPHPTDVMRTSVTLSWYGPAFDGGSQITFYRIEMKKPEDTNWELRVPCCKNTFFQIDDLEPNSEYVFRVSAENKHGVSSPGDASEIVKTGDSQPLSYDYESDDELPFEPQDVTISPGKIFEDHYDIMHEVGKGKFGNVYKCKEKKTGKTWAAKIVKCREKEKEDVRHEIDIMKSLAHPKVLMIWDAYEAPRRMVLVMEYIGGGELFERVIGEGFVLTERDCVIFMRQICSGVSYMHTKGILHLDLKPENILCISENTNQVKIIDFGLARRFEEGNSIKVMFGTPEFIAPEVVNYDEISFATDMWSLGVICYVLLSGLSPFMGDNDPETLANVTSGEYDFDDESFNDISDNAKDFIQRLLVKNKEKRSTISQSQQHIWLAQDERQIRSKRLNTERLRRFMARRKWQVCEECEVFRKDTKEISHSGEATVCRNSQSENETATHQSQDEHQDLKTSSQGSERENLPISGLDLTENECSVNENNFSSCYDGTDPKAYRDENHVDIPTDLTQSKPNFVKTMVDCEAFAGDVIRFDVRVAGSPEAEIHWLHEEDEVQEDERHIMDTNNNGQCSLIIRKVTEDDEGEYMCTAVNSCGEASCSAELIVCGSGAF